jgi:hypothetical protein
MLSLEQLDHTGSGLGREELYLEPSLESIENRISLALRKLWPVEAIPLADVRLESVPPEDAPLGPLLLASGGVLAIVGGIVFTTHASGLGSELNTMPLVDQSFRDLDSERRLTAGLSYGFIIGGASCLVGAVLLEVFDR